MTAKSTLDLMGQVYRLIDRDPDTFRSAEGTYTGIIEGCEKLRRAAMTLQRWAEKQCNGIDRWDAKLGRVMASWTEADDKAMEKAQDRAEKLALTGFHLIFAEKMNGLEAEFQRDPRGAMVKLWPKGKKDSGSPLLAV